MCVLDLEQCEVWVETGRTARKTHQCTACKGTISSGQRYYVHFSVLDKMPDYQKICSACYEDRKVFADAHEGVIPTPGGFAFVLQDCIYEGDEESEARWKPMLEALKARGAQA